MVGPWTGKRIRTLVRDMNEVELNAGVICPDCHGPRHTHADDCRHWKCDNPRIIEHACGMAEVHIPIGWCATVGEMDHHDKELGDMYAVSWDDNPDAANPDRTTSNMGWCIWGEVELEKNAVVIDS